MDDLKSTQLPETQVADSPRRFGVPSPSTALRVLWDATGEGRQLSQEQLEWLAGSTEAAGLMLQNLQTVLMGTGCLILADAGQEGAKNGMLQTPGDIADTLFMAEKVVDAAAGMIEIGDAASFRAYHPLGRLDAPAE